MKRLGILVLILFALIAGGAITSQLTGSSDLRVIKADSPDASVFEATPDQSTAFFLMVGFILFNIIGAAVTFMLIFWLLDRGIRSVKGTPAAQGQASEAVETS